MVQFFHDRGTYHNRNQYIDFLCKSMDWFLYDWDLRYERVKNFQSVLNLNPFHVCSISIPPKNIGEPLVS